MAENSKIEWCEKTWNPVVGCTRASAGCDHCYAVGMTKRLEAMGHAKYAGLVGNGHFNGVVRTVPEDLDKPLKWKKPAVIFVNSMSDLFHKSVPFEFIDQVFAVMALCPQHTFQVLTKRPERMAEYLSQRRDIGHFMSECHMERNGVIKAKAADYDDLKNGWQHCSAAHEWPLNNVWLGTSCENQETADERIPHLLKCPAAVRFLSLEPLLGPVDLSPWILGRCPKCKGDGHEGHFPTHREYWGKGGSSKICPHCRTTMPDYPMRPNGEEYFVPDLVSWLIIGGESGANPRPYNLQWPRDIIKQCRDAGVPVFHKQLGAHAVSEYQADHIGRKKHGAAFGSLDPSPEPYRMWLDDTKGGNPEEWPEDLRVRQHPKPVIKS